jgi:hypothetical protein
MAPFIDARKRPARATYGSSNAATSGPCQKTKRLQSAHDQLACSDEPPEWFAKRLSTALRGAGLTVLEGDAPAPGDVLQIQGTLHQLDAESISLMYSALFESDVHIQLEVSSEAGLTASRGFHVKASRSKMGGGMGTLQTVLDESSTRIVRDMTAAILSLLNRYPTVGRPLQEPAPLGEPDGEPASGKGP